MKKYIAGLLTGMILSLATVTYASVTVETILFPVKFIFNGQNKVFSDDYIPLNYKGHVYVPIRFVAESMGAGVAYDPNENQVSVLINSQEGTGLTDEAYPMIHIANLKVRMENVEGQILIESPPQNEDSYNRGYCYFDLLFYDKDGKMIGKVEYGNGIGIGGDEIDFKYNIVNDFKAPTRQSLMNYTSVKMKVEYQGIYPIRGKTPPLPNISVDNQQIPSAVGTYCWYSCAEAMVQPSIFVKDQIPVKVSPNEKLQIKFNYQPEPILSRIMRYRSTDEFIEGIQENITGQMITVPSEKGIYIYSFQAIWKITGSNILFADAMYYFTIEVK